MATVDRRIVFVADRYYVMERPLNPQLRRRAGWAQVGSGYRSQREALAAMITDSGEA